MAGTLTIQRVARGLLNVLGNYGGQTPPELADKIQGTIDTLQFFGQQQQTALFATNAAAASGSGLTIAVPSNQYWLLASLTARAIEQAAMTQLRLTLKVSPNFQIVAYGEKNAAFAGGATYAVPWVAPYLYILPPGASLDAEIAFAGVANANWTLQAAVGVLG